MTIAPQFIHASCVVIGETGVLVRGESGSGKSTLCRRLMTQAHLRGHFAALVGDDRVQINSTNRRIIARSHRAVAGKMEVFGLGIGATNVEEAAIVRLVVDCVAFAPERLPAVKAQNLEIAGVNLPRIFCRAHDEDVVFVALGLDPLSMLELT